MDFEVEPEELKDGDARWETGAIPKQLREQVLERDQGLCRFCGTWAEEPALHHVRYRSEGGFNRLDNLITVHWMWRPRCHEAIHSRKRLYQPVLLEIVKLSGVTALQYMRWQRERERNQARRQRIFGLTRLGGPEGGSA